MNDLQIKYFFNLAKTRNFTKTAKEFNVTQPTISKQITALEREIGFTLFNRSRRSVSLTPIGMIFIKAFKQAVEIYKNAINEANIIYKSENRKLRIGYLEGMDISNLLNKIFESFNNHYPNIEYQVECHSPSNLSKALYNNDLDVIITLDCLLENNPILNSSVILTEKHLLYIPSNHPILSKECFNITDFKDETFIALDPSVVHCKCKYKFFDWCEENGLIPKKVKFVPNVESQILSVEGGLGVTIANSLFRLYNNHSFKSIELKTSESIFIVWKKNNTNLLTESFANLASQINSETYYK